MVYALAVSVALSTLALVMLAVLQLARGLLRRAQLRRRTTLSLALRLRSELYKELDQLQTRSLATRRCVRAMGSRNGPVTGQLLFEIDRLDDLHTQAIQSLRDRLDRASARLDEPIECEMERLCQTLSDLTAEVNLLAAETAKRRVTGSDRSWWRPTARRPMSPARRAA